MHIHVRHTTFHFCNIYTISTPPHVYLVLLLELTVVRVISRSSIICVYAVLCAVVERSEHKGNLLFHRLLSKGQHLRRVRGVRDAVEQLAVKLTQDFVGNR